MDGAGVRTLRRHVRIGLGPPARREPTETTAVYARPLAATLDRLPRAPPRPLRGLSLDSVEAGPRPRSRRFRARCEPAARNPRRLTGVVHGQQRWRSAQREGAAQTDMDMGWAQFNSYTRNTPDADVRHRTAYPAMQGSPSSSQREEQCKPARTLAAGFAAALTMPRSELP